MARVKQCREEWDMEQKDFHSDDDGDLFLHSDDPQSDGWIVEVKHAHSDRWVKPSREKIGFPYLIPHWPRNAWYVDRGSLVRITKADGTTTQQT